MAVFFTRGRMAGMFPNHDIQTLHAMLRELAFSDIRDADLPPEDVGMVAELFRDLRLELIRFGGVQFSVEQLHRLLQLDYRLQMVATRQAVPSSINSEAKLTLAAFGWSADA